MTYEQAIADIAEMLPLQEVDERITAIRVQNATLRVDLSVARQSLYEVADQRNKAYARVAELEREVDVLRRYGNKDCTNMADVVLSTGKGTT